MSRSLSDAAPAIRHLGFGSSLEYFVSSDLWRFDWSPFRLA